MFEDVNRACERSPRLRSFPSISRVALCSAKPRSWLKKPVESRPDFRPRRAWCEKKLLASAGVPMLAEHFAADDAEVARAQCVNGPTVLKILSPDIAHKTEVGVVVGLASPEAAAQAARLCWRARAPAQRQGAWLPGGATTARRD